MQNLHVQLNRSRAGSYVLGNTRLVSNSFLDQLLRFQLLRRLEPLTNTNFSICAGGAAGPAAATDGPLVVDGGTQLDLPQAFHSVLTQCAGIAPTSWRLLPGDRLGTCISRAAESLVFHCSQTSSESTVQCVLVTHTGAGHSGG